MCGDVVEFRFNVSRKRRIPLRDQALSLSLVVSVVLQIEVRARGEWVRSLVCWLR